MVFAPEILKVADGALPSPSRGAQINEKEPCRFVVSATADPPEATMLKGGFKISIDFERPAAGGA